MSTLTNILRNKSDMKWNTERPWLNALALDSFSGGPGFHSWRRPSWL